MSAGRLYAALSGTVTIGETISTSTNVRHPAPSSPASDLVQTKTKCTTPSATRISWALTAMPSRTPFRLTLLAADRFRPERTSPEMSASMESRSARLLRRILVDHAKAHNRDKRGGGVEKLSLDEAILVGPQATGGIVELDEALQRLAVHDQRKSELIELLFFGGLTYDETAAALKISPATVHRELKMAKAWLHRELTQSMS